MAIVAVVGLKSQHYTLWQHELCQFLKLPHFTKITIKIYIICC